MKVAYFVGADPGFLVDDTAVFIVLFYMIKECIFLVCCCLCTGNPFHHCVGTCNKRPNPEGDSNIYRQLK
ncbi:hypothetical protein Q3G72_032417 [Acer saccharum]|nr:hypothetical protein Q3G72_032417 [Acer saccharum]